MKKRFLPGIFLFAVIFNFPVKSNHQRNIRLIYSDTAISGKWYLQPVLASDVATGKLPAIDFNLLKNVFSGNTGCNSMRGSFKLMGTKLIFDKQIITTKMACIGYDEDVFIKNLLRTNQYKIEKGVLILMMDHTELSRWVRNAKPAKKTDTV